MKVVHSTRDDTADHGDGHPNCQRKAAVLWYTVHEDAVEEGAYERSNVDRHGHVLRHGAGVAEALDQGRVEIGEGRGTHDGHVADDKDPGAPVHDGALQGLHMAELLLVSLGVWTAVLKALDCQLAFAVCETLVVLGEV